MDYAVAPFWINQFQVQAGEDALSAGAENVMHKSPHECDVTDILENAISSQQR